MFALDDVMKLGDDTLLERLGRSVGRDRAVTVQLLLELGEVDARGLFRELGFSSMFAFATGVTVRGFIIPFIMCGTRSAPSTAPPAA